jgi:hypothetical protein
MAPADHLNLSEREEDYPKPVADAPSNEHQFVWDQGKPQKQPVPVIERQPAVAPAAAQPRITFWKIAWAVFVGNLLFGIFGALIYALSRM